MSYRWKPSFYNHAVAYRNGILIFNGVSSGLIFVTTDIFEKLRSYLFGESSFDPQFIEPALRGLFDGLYRGQYFIDESADELDYLRQRYRFYQRNTPLTVMITTTMDCNLDCYYCFEDKHAVYLNRQNSDRIFEYIRRHAEEQRVGKVFTTWFGGEPMLNQDAIEYLSKLLIEHCEQKGLKYSSSIISNGTRWPDDAAEFVARTRIRHIQFSFDGLPDNHNRRRHYKEKPGPDTLSSFESMSRVIDKLVGKAKLYLRINLDPKNSQDAYPLVDHFYEKGWLYPGSKVYPYLAHIAPLSSACSFLEKSAIDTGDFDRLNNEFRRYLAKYVSLKDFQHLQFYPQSLKLNCGAVAGIQ